MVLPTKRLVAAAKFLVAATKKLFFVPNFIAVTKPFFSVILSVLPDRYCSPEFLVAEMNRTVHKISRFDNEVINCY